MMRRLLAVMMVSVISLLLMGQVVLAAGDSPARFPKPFNLQGTTWIGSVTYVDTTGATTTSDNCTIRFDSQNNNLFAGRFVDPATAANSFDFSGVVGPFKRKFLHIGGAEHVAFADIVRPFKGGLVFRGHDTQSGVSFLGTFKKQ